MPREQSGWNTSERCQRLCQCLDAAPVPAERKQCFQSGCGNRCHSANGHWNNANKVNATNTLNYDIFNLVWHFQGGASAKYKQIEIHSFANGVFSAAASATFKVSKSKILTAIKIPNPEFGHRRGRFLSFGN